jgi:hypothetical protein
MGNKPIWPFEEGWQAALDLPGSIAMARWGAFFRGLRWGDLRPDLKHRIGIDGLGEARGLDRVTVASTDDGHLTVAYLPAPKPLTIDSSALAGPQVRAEWFEPATGRSLPGGVLVPGGTITLTPPFPEDAVLTLETV